MNIITDTNEKKKSMQNIMKAFYIGSKILPKIIDNKKKERSNLNNNGNHQKSQLDRFQRIKGLSYQKQSKLTYKKPILFQINFNQSSDYYTKNQSIKYRNPNQKKSLEKLSVVLSKLNTNTSGNNYNGFDDMSAKKQMQKIKYNQIGINRNSCITSLITSPQIHKQTMKNQDQQSKSQTIKIQEQSSKQIIKQKKNDKKRNLVFSNHDQTYKYYLGPGNNSGLIRKIMSKRLNWSETSQSNSIFNLRWTQHSENQKLDRIILKNGIKQLINHFQFHEQITTKSGLIRNLRILSQKQQKFNLFDVTPITFEIDFTIGQMCQAQLKKFVHFFIQNHPNQKNIPKIKKKQQDRKSYNEFIKQIKNIHDLKNHTFDKKQHPNSKPILRDIYSQGDIYLWLLKPTGLNRGRGIYLFKALEELGQIMLQIHQKSRSQISQSIKRQSSTLKEKIKEIKSVFIKQQSYVIQKYIQKPLLINNRKFDIRMWVLLTNELDTFFFKQGYIRTSCQQYDVQKQDLYVHLTNNAVQKNSPNYGNFQTGNQLSFDDLEKIMEELQNKKLDEKNDELNPQIIQQQKVGFRKSIIPQLKRMICLPFQSIKKKMNSKETNNCFQIFGYDFMIDQNYKPWLIEINTNPCIQESSPLLQKLLPRMLDDAFSLTLDIMFNNKKRLDVSYHIDGYEDNQNMWQFLEKWKQNKRGNYK